MRSHSKYLPGLSYGMSGGPRPLSWGPEPRSSSYYPNENGPGKYTFSISGRKEGKSIHLEMYTFEAGSLREAQAKAEVRSHEIGGTWTAFEAYEGDFPGSPPMYKRVGG